MTLRENIIVRLPGVVLTLVASLLLWHTFDPSYSGRLQTLQFGPVFFPRIILAVWIVLSLPLIFIVPVVMREMLLDNRKYLPGLAFAAALVAYLWVLPGLGYLISTFAFALAIQAIAGDRNLIKLILGAALLSGLSWFCFEYLLEIVLPAGRWI